MSRSAGPLTTFYSVAERPNAFTSAQMRELDRLAIETVGVPGPVLMERAGLGVAEFILRTFPGRRTLVVCGRGNNGGDGLAAARQLHLAGQPVVCVVAADDPTSLSPDARLNLEAARRLGVPLQLGATANTVESHTLRDAELVVDCLLGTGASGEIKEPLAGLARMINSLGARGVPVVAVDVPSGVDAGTGSIAGDTVVATHTITFHSAKTGLVVPPGCEAAGEVLVWEIGLPGHLEPGPDVRVVTEADVVVPGRRPDDHKYKAGYVALVAGSGEYPGAALLAARAAVAAGAGYVRLFSTSDVVSALRPALAEVTATDTEVGSFLRDAERALEVVSDSRISTLAIGPGLGRQSETARVVRTIVRRTSVPAVLDADGLAAFAGQSRSLAERPGLVLTPHPGELAALMEWPVTEVVQAPLSSARRAAAETGQVTLLKGPATVIAEPSGGTWVVTQGPAQLASAGTGDVLTGIIAALLAKGLAPLQAASAGAWLHAEAGRLAAEERRAGVAASDLLAAIPTVLIGRVQDRRPSWAR